MVTKAIVINRIVGTTKYLVRIPIFETLNNSAQPDNLTNAALFEATLCYSPGNTDGIVPNDVVFVSFENNDYNNVVILGKLYLGDETKPTSHQNINNLVVNGSTVLNGPVRINGTDISMLLDHNQGIDDLFGITDEQAAKWRRMRDWVIEANHGGLVLNFFREKK